MTDSIVPLLEVKIAVAVSDMGIIRCVPYEPCHIQRHQQYLDWKHELEMDKHKWQVSVLSANVPIPCEPIIEASICK